MIRMLALAALATAAFTTIERVTPSIAEAQAQCHANCDAKFPPQGRARGNVQCKAKCK